MTQATATAVIVSYRSRDTLGRALEQAHVCVEAGLLADVVVVDNDSNDGTAQYVREAHPWATLIESGGNIGFARGCNLGFEHVRTPYLLLLNPDAVMPVDALRYMLDFMESRSDAGIVGPAIREPDGALQHAGGLATPGRIIKSAAGFAKPYPQRRDITPGDEPRETDWVCGAIMLIRSDLWRKLDGFDPRFFLYWEETDFCKRAATNGARIWALGKAVCEHAAGASAEQSGESTANRLVTGHYYRSRFYYLTKHHGYLAAAMVDIIELMLIAARSLLNSVRRRPGKAALRDRLKAPLLTLPEKVNTPVKAV